MAHTVTMVTWNNWHRKQDGLGVKNTN